MWLQVYVYLCIQCISAAESTIDNAMQGMGQVVQLCMCICGTIVYVYLWYKCVCVVAGECMCGCRGMHVPMQGYACIAARVCV